MFNILQSTQLSSNTFDFWLEAPRIATHAQAGQFVILRIDEKGERIPLTIAETNPQAGSIRIIFQVIGKTTAALSQQQLHFPNLKLQTLCWISLDL